MRITDGLRWLFFKARIGPKGADLFEAPVRVAAHTTKEGTFVPAHMSHRQKRRPEPPKAAPAKPAGDLFSYQPPPKRAPDLLDWREPEPAKPAPKPEPKPEPVPEPAPAKPEPPAPPPEPPPAPAVPIPFGVPPGTSKAQRRAWNQEAASLLRAKGDGPYTPDELAVLARYSGTGGVGVSLNEFYTPVPVAAAMWDMLRACGFQGGDVLEPSAGTGVFLHTAPDNAKLQAVELDPTSAAICAILHPNATVETASLERFATQDGRKFDAVIGNPPYGPRGELIKDDKKTLTLAETYFVDTALDKAKDGGLVALVLPTRIMDSQPLRSFRERMLTKADFIAAFRMPNTAFEAAHTEVTTDIVLLRKRPQDVAGALSVLNGRDLPRVGISDESFLAGSYFSDRGAANVLGTMEPGWRAKAFGGNDITVTGAMTGIPEHLAAWTPTERELADPGVTVQKVLEVIGDDNPALQRRAIHAAITPPYQQAKAGETRSINGVLYVLEGEPLRWHRVDEPVAEAVQDAQPIGAMLDDLIHGRSKDPGFVRAQLIEALDQWVADHGIPARNKALKAWLDKPSLPMGTETDPLDHAAMVQERRRLVARLLGAVSPTGAYSDLVTGKDRALGERDMETVAQALSLEHGRFTPDQLLEAWGQGDIQAVLDGLYASHEYALSEDGQSWSTMDVYLSGELWPKLDTVKGLILHEGITDAAKAKYEMQAKRLEETIAPVTLDDVEISLNSGFVLPQEIAAFINTEREEYLAEGRGQYPPGAVTISFENGVYRFHVSNGYRGRDVDLIETFLNRTGVRKDDYDRLTALNERFKDWLLTSDFREAAEERYNRAYRGFRPAHMSDAPIHLPGMTTEKTVNPYIWQAVRWAVEAGKGICAADVGLGKTVTALLLAKLGKTLGTAKKPTIVVPKSVMSNWLAEIEMWFPGSKVLAIGETQTTDANGKVTSKSDDAETRRAKYHAMQQNDYDFVLISKPAWDDLDVDPITKGQYIEGDFWVQRGDALGQAGDKRVNRIREAYKQSVAKREFDKERQDTIYFNDLGVDMLIMDEAHAYKNLYSVRNRFGGKPKFLGGGAESNTALDTFFKSKSVREANAGKGVYMLTATPTKNSPLEVYSMLSHIAPEAFERLGIRNSEDFLDRFCVFEMDATLGVGGKWEEALVTKGFKNMDELREVMKRFIDRKTAEDVGLVIPKADNREHLVDMSPEQERLYQALRAQALAPKKKDASGDEHIFSIMDKMGKVALDPALVGEDGPTPKIDACVAEAIAGAKEGGQIIFCEALPSHAKIKAKLVAAGMDPKEIGFISADATPSGAARQNVANAFNDGKLKVIIANKTAEEGVNLQKRTSDIHHLDLPWNAAGLQQRNGRGRRQGNKAESIRIHNYFAKGSFDAYRYQTVASKKDWQDALWNGGNEVENLAMEGKFSPAEMMVMLSPDPTAAAAKLADDKAEAERQANIAGRVKAAILYEQMLRMKDSLSALQARGDKGGMAAVRLEQAIRQRRDALATNPRFTRKDILDKRDVVYEPFSGFAWEAGDGFDLTPGPDAPADWGTEPSKWVITGITKRMSGAVLMARPYGQLANAQPLYLTTTDMRSGVTPFAYDKAEEAKTIEAEFARLEAAAGEEAAKKLQQAAKLETIKKLPPDAIERMAPLLTKNLKAAMLAYSDGSHAVYGMLKDGEPVAVKGYDARKMLDTHDPMLPTPANRAKVIEGWVNMRMQRYIDTEHAPSSGRRGRYQAPQALGVTAKYPGFEYDSSIRGNPWAHVAEDLFDKKSIIDEAKPILHQRVLANIAAAADARAAVLAAIPRLAVTRTGVTWPPEIAEAVAAKLRAAADPEASVRTALGRIGGYKEPLHEAVLKIGGKDYGRQDYGRYATNIPPMKLADFIAALEAQKPASASQSSTISPVGDST